ncbi:hypothetical protein [Vulcanisaeta distributa]|uniref:hypothetical protein n=1 Tax=Vulcanisaeta distributa TaxID=164451 RepID=UPI0006D164D2|nr:hypothetical protein [Vulcanisaeta distributa]
MVIEEMPLLWITYDELIPLNVPGLNDDVEIYVKDLVDKGIDAVVSASEHLGSKESRFMEIREDILSNANEVFSVLTGFNFEFHDELFIKDLRHHYRNIAEGVKRMMLISITLALADYLRKRGRSPIIFIENFEASLHVDYVNDALTRFRDYEFPIVIETHNASYLSTQPLINLSTT